MIHTGAQNLARVLHDDIIQRMMSISWMADNLGLDQKQVEAISQAVVDVADRLRQAIKSFAPNLEVTSLANAIAQLPTVQAIAVSGLDSLPLDQRYYVYCTVHDILSAFPPSCKINVSAWSKEETIWINLSGESVANHTISFPAVRVHKAGLVSVTFDPELVSRKPG